LGILAVELGWVVTEVGRQPWVIQGVMKTHEGVSPGLTGTEATITLVGFVATYAALLGLYAYVVARIIRAGPPGGEDLTSTVDEEAGPPRRPDADVPTGVTGDD
jgi:cytochrome d ubiquinol oxidase subunit I